MSSKDETNLPKLVEEDQFWTKNKKTFFSEELLQRIARPTFASLQLSRSRPKRNKFGWVKLHPLIQTCHKNCIDHSNYPISSNELVTTEKVNEIIKRVQKPTKCFLNSVYSGLREDDAIQRMLQRRFRESSVDKHRLDIARMSTMATRSKMVGKCFYCNEMTKRGHCGYFQKSSVMLH